MGRIPVERAADSPARLGSDDDGSVLQAGSPEAKQHCLQAGRPISPRMGPIYSECPVDNMNCIYVGHCTNSNFRDLIMLTAGNPDSILQHEREELRGRIIHSFSNTRGEPRCAQHAECDDKPQLLTIFLLDCPAHKHISQLSWHWK